MAPLADVYKRQTLLSDASRDNSHRELLSSDPFSSRTTLPDLSLIHILRSLEEKGLIRTEPTMVRSKDDSPLNGNLIYTIRPIQAAVELFYERHFQQLEEDAARQRAAERLAELARESPQNALCAPFGAEASPSAAPGVEAQFGPLSETLPGTKEKAG